MKYEILKDGKVIASFVFKSDRDICLDALTDEHEDCVFIARDL